MLTLITFAQILLYVIGIVAIVSLTLVYIHSEFLGYTRNIEKENSERRIMKIEKPDWDFVQKDLNLSDESVSHYRELLNDYSEREEIDWTEWRHIGGEYLQINIKYHNTYLQLKIDKG